MNYFNKAKNEEKISREDLKVKTAGLDSPSSNPLPDYSSTSSTKSTSSTLPTPSRAC